MTAPIVKNVQREIQRMRKILYVDPHTFTELKADPGAHMHFYLRPDGSLTYMGCEVVVVYKDAPYFHVTTVVEE